MCSELIARSESPSNAGAIDGEFDQPIDPKVGLAKHLLIASGQRRLPWQGRDTRIYLDVDVSVS
jgi:hypothetical protein